MTEQRGREGLLRCSGLANSDDWSSALTCPVPLSAPTPPALHVFQTNAKVSELAAPPSLKLLQFNANVLELATAADHIKAQNRHFINFKRADWAAFIAECEAGIDGLPHPNFVYTVERAVRQLLLTAAGHHVPNGRIPLLRPNYPPEAVRLEREREREGEREVTYVRVMPMARVSANSMA
ncbi:unnamed protein product [Dibothriocephalus latus]|uniref:Uncharacterized protein n=1 Tax=Dibothriocephalus latus TaxID=60516 RepID=A0A3P7NIN8_DIBLA|nr:unnamed protein product [Dibothriocephalus latus]